MTGACLNYIGSSAGNVDGDSIGAMWHLILTWRGPEKLDTLEALATNDSGLDTTMIYR